MHNVMITRLTGCPAYDRLATIPPAKAFEGKKEKTKAVYYAGYKKLITLNLTGDIRAQALEMLEQYKPAKIEQVIYKDKLPTREAVHLAEKKAKPKYSTLIDFLKSTGLRISEALSIKYDQIEAGDIIAVQVLGKGRKERRVIIPSDIYARIVKHWGAEGRRAEKRKEKQTGVFLPELRLFPITRITAYKALKRLGFSPHKLRHFFGTQAVEAGISIDKVSKYMGHSSAAITVKYYLHGQITGDDITKIRGFL